MNPHGNILKERHNLISLCQFTDQWCHMVRSTALIDSYCLSDITIDKKYWRNEPKMKTIKSLCIMKNECTIIMYKENKHKYVAYNVENNYEKVLFQ